MIFYFLWYATAVILYIYGMYQVISSIVFKRYRGIIVGIFDILVPFLMIFLNYYFIRYIVILAGLLNLFAIYHKRGGYVFRLTSIIIILCLVFANFVFCDFHLFFSNIKEEFHKFEAAEVIGDSVLYFDDNKLVYDDNIISDSIYGDIWIENTKIYYQKDSKLNVYDVSNNKNLEYDFKPYTIIGKYNNSIISYHGKNIYQISNNKIKKLFKDTYYLNSAYLIRNKIYAVPATNIYEYNIDSSKINKITNKNYNTILKNGNDIYIREVDLDDNVTKYYRLNSRKEFIASFNEEIVDEFIIDNSMFIVTKSKNNKETLYYVNNGVKMIIDTGKNYDIMGVIQNTLYYNVHGNIDDENSTYNYIYTFNGITKKKYKDLGKMYFQDLTIYNSNHGIILLADYDEYSELFLLKDGKLNLIFDARCIVDINVVEDNLYIKYFNSEDDFSYFGNVIKLA